MTFLVLALVLFIGIAFGIHYSDNMVQKEIDLRKRWESIAKKLLYNKQYSGSKLSELYGQYCILTNTSEQECLSIANFIQWMEEKNEENIEL